MKVLLFVGLILATLLAVECKKHHHHGKKLVTYKVDDKPLSNTFHQGSTHRKYDRLRGSHLKLREGGKSKSLHDWMKIPKDNKCTKTTCGHKEFCLVNPKTAEEKCINIKHFREGRKLFKNYHREHEFLKKDMNIDVNEKDLSTAEHMKDVYELLKDFKKHNHKQLKVKSLMKTMDLSNIKEAGSVEECRPHELYELKKRMVGWFVLLHTESRQRKHHMNHKKHDKHGKHGKKHLVVETIDLHGDIVDVKKKDKKLDTKRITKSVHEGQHIQTETHHKCKCSKSVMWDFRKKDLNEDGSLSHEELTSLEHLKREPCLKPLFKSCDTNSDGSLTHGEWCCCMANTIPPCADKKRLTDPKDWAPRCDKEGYYEREQCHDKSGYCWCVDINGNQIHGTKRLGSGHCGKYDPNGQLYKEY